MNSNNTLGNAMEINYAPLANFSLAKILQFFARFILIVNRIGADKLKIETQFNDFLLPSYKRLDDAYKKSQKSKHTEVIESLSKTVRSDIIGIFGFIKAMEKNSDKTLSAAAKNLRFVIKLFSGITKKTLNERCAEVTNFIQEVKLNYSEDIKALGLEKWFGELEEHNNALIAAMDARSNERADKSKTNTIMPKIEVINAYRAICKLIEVYVFTEGAKDYADFVLNVNDIVAEFGGSTKSVTDISGGSSSENGSNGSNGGDEGGNGNISQEIAEKIANAVDWYDLTELPNFKVGDYCFLKDAAGNKEYWECIDFRERHKYPRNPDTEPGWKLVVL